MLDMKELGMRAKKASYGLALCTGNKVYAFSLVANGGGHSFGKRLCVKPGAFRLHGHVCLEAYDGIYVGGFASCYCQIKVCIHQSKSFSILLGSTSGNTRHRCSRMRFRD
jgi:hypothetical protein